MFMNYLMAINWTNTITNAIEKVLGPLLIVLCSVGTIYAVVVGIKMLKAEDKNAREENKQRLINIAISIVAVIALIAIFYALKAWLENKGKNNGIEDVKQYIEQK